MLQTKPDLILRSMSQYELNRLDHFVPSATSDERIVRTWSYIRPFYKESIPEALDKLNIWRQAYPKTKFVPIKYARLLSDLTKVIEKFLLMEYIVSNESGKAIALMEIYNSRGLGSCVQPLIKDTQSVKIKYPYRDSQYYLSSYLIDEQKNAYIENQELLDADKHLSETMKSLDTYYVLQKLKFYATALHYQKFMNLPVEIHLIEEVIRFAESQIFSDIAIIQIYKAIIHTLQDENASEAFEELSLLLKRNVNAFPMKEAEELYAFAVNYCIRMINRGELDYVPKIFSLYKQMLKDGLLTYKGNISPWEFKNIVTIALRAKELKWAADFIDDYSPFITLRDRQNAYTYNMARYAFAAAKYDKVLELLSDVEYDDVFYLLDAKTTLMKTYYELSEDQAIQSLKESFRILLSRTKAISETQRTVYGNFVRYTLKLFRIDTKNKKKVALLRTSIENTKQIADKGWLIEKLNELGT